MKQPIFYRCAHCGNLANMVIDGHVTPICCGSPMQKLEANTTDAAQEKHVPAVKRDGTALNVQVGSVAHPMTTEHHIAWIAVVQGDTLQLTHLDPQGSPTATFCVTDGPLTVYEWCNLHGLWKVEA